MAKNSEKDKSKKEKKNSSKAVKKASIKVKKSSKKASMISVEQRLDMIATAAYYIAEKHGFDPNRVVQNWIEAEQQIDAMLKSEKQPK